MEAITETMKSGSSVTVETFLECLTSSIQRQDADANAAASRILSKTSTAVSVDHDGLVCLCAAGAGVPVEHMRAAFEKFGESEQSASFAGLVKTWKASGLVALGLRTPTEE